MKVVAFRATVQPHLESAGKRAVAVVHPSAVRTSIRFKFTAKARPEPSWSGLKATEPDVWPIS
jgi:hypothetical protein